MGCDCEDISPEWLLSAGRFGQKLPDVGDYARVGERFANEAVNPRFRRQSSQFLFALRGDQHYRDLLAELLFPQELGLFVTVQHGKHDIENNEVWPGFREDV